MPAAAGSGGCARDVGASRSGASAGADTRRTTGEAAPSALGGCWCTRRLGAAAAGAALDPPPRHAAAAGTGVCEPCPASTATVDTTSWCRPNAWVLFLPPGGVTGIKVRCWGRRKKKNKWRSPEASSDSKEEEPPHPHHTPKPQRRQPNSTDPGDSHPHKQQQEEGHPQNHSPDRPEGQQPQETRAQTKSAQGAEAINRRESRGRESAAAGIRRPRRAARKTRKKSPKKEPADSRQTAAGSTEQNQRTERTNNTAGAQPQLDSPEHGPAHRAATYLNHNSNGRRATANSSDRPGAGQQAAGRQPQTAASRDSHTHKGKPESQPTAGRPDTQAQQAPPKLEQRQPAAAAAAAAGLALGGRG